MGLSYLYDQDVDSSDGEKGLGRLEGERDLSSVPSPAGQASPGLGGCLGLGVELKERCLELKDASVSHQHRAVN